MTAADRPSVTDNARDEEPLAWCPGCGDRIPTEVVRERGVCSNCHGTSDDPWAAARAETATAHECDSGDFDRTICDCGAMHSYCTICGTRQDDCPHGTTTATIEDAARAIHDRHCTSDDHGPHCMFWGEDYESAEALHARGLLATARTRPTREELARAIAAVVHHVGYEPDHPTPNRHDYRAADAVLALLADQPETTTEWGVRFYGRGPFDVACDSREDAEAEVAAVEDKHAPAVLIRREVTAWTEADQ